MSLAFIDLEINAIEFHDLGKDMSNISDGGTEKSNYEIHQNFVIFGLSIVENNRVTHFQTRLNFFCFSHNFLRLDFQVVVQKQKMLRIFCSFSWNQLSESRLVL